MLPTVDVSLIGLHCSIDPFDKRLHSVMMYCMTVDKNAFVSINIGQ